MFEESKKTTECMKENFSSLEKLNMNAPISILSNPLMKIIRNR